MVELTWEGKYDENGKRTAPLRLALPFQTGETVNESVQERQMALDLFRAGRPPHRQFRTSSRKAALCLLTFRVKGLRRQNVRMKMVGRRHSGES